VHYSAYHNVYSGGKTWRWYVEDGNDSDGSSSYSKLMCINVPYIVIIIYAGDLRVHLLLHSVHAPLLAESQRVPLAEYEAYAGQVLAEV
jgi:hypothetical protein